MAKMKMVLKRVRLNKGNVRKMLKSQEAMNIVKDHAYRTQAGLGEGYGVMYDVGTSRARATVYTESYEARKENSGSNNMILKALR